MIGFNGGLIGGLANARDTSTLKSNPGVWTLAEQRKAIFTVPTAWPTSGVTLPAIGAAFGGGFFAGTISHTADGVATHALIVAPKATGASGTGYTLTTNYAWKTTATSTTGTGSSFDGYANTAAMETAGLANHPAANFCRGLTIGGFSDWYYPSHYELDIAYENLKPSTANNITSFGINPYSVPERTANRTAGAPAQTSVAAFQSGGVEAFVATGNNHGTSTQNDATSAYWMSIDNGFTATSNFGVTKTNAFAVRAFRRVVL
jgi:hypothetical protein